MYVSAIEPPVLDADATPPAPTTISTGPLAVPADAQYILDHTAGIVGFYGVSSMERLPVEPAIAGRVREFTEMKL